jgi:hypothetical protein
LLDFFRPSLWPQPANVFTKRLMRTGSVEVGELPQRWRI